MDKRLKRSYALPLLDPLRPFRRRPSRTTAFPRISFPGYTVPCPVPLRRALSPDDIISAARLALRLKALAAALDDMPGHAKRFLRWTMRRRQGRRVWPLKPGGPPGRRLPRFDPGAPRPLGLSEVDEVLAHAHALAIHALDPPDTS